MTEKFAFDESFGNRPAVDRNKGIFGSWTSFVKETGNPLLSCPAFSGDKNGRVASGNRDSVGTASPVESET